MSIGTSANKKCISSLRVLKSYATPLLTNANSSIRESEIKFVPKKFSFLLTEVQYYLIHVRPWTDVPIVQIESSQTCYFRHLRCPNN